MCDKLSETIISPNESKEESETQIKRKDYNRVLEEVVYIDFCRWGGKDSPNNFAYKSAFKLFTLFFNGASTVGGGASAGMAAWMRNVRELTEKQQFDEDYNYVIRSIHAGKKKGTMEHFEAILRERPKDLELDKWDGETLIQDFGPIDIQLPTIPTKSTKSSSSSSDSDGAYDSDCPCDGCNDQRNRSKYVRK